MKTLRIRHRLAVITLAASIGLILVAGLSLMRLNNVMRDGVADRTRKIVETGHSIVASYEAQVRAGRMTEAQAKQAALGALEVMRYGDNDYLFVTDHQPRMVMHPMKPEMDGTGIGDKVDIDGVYPFREMSATVRANGEGVVGYRWPKPGAEEPQPKLSFVKGFAPWGWIIGSGVYVDDLRTAIWRETMTMVGIILAILTAVCGLTIMLGRSISRPIVGLTGRMRSLAGGDTHSEIPGGQRSDEIGEMAQALEVFRVTAIEKGKADAAREAADREQRKVVDVVSTHLSDLSNGDLTTSITAEFPASYEALKNNFNNALAKLRTLIGSVAESAATIRTGSNEIAQASEDLARRTEANAASIEQTSAAVTQMDGRIRATADAANSTVVRANGALETVSDGREIADRAVKAMTRVADSAEGIDSVIEGLDKIAFQTRVLAMNAAVEAGRAGEAGRGFAVVADLVSALAMRSEEEAARARDQLTTTQTDIIAAVEMVQKVDGALGNISTDVDAVHKLLDRIATDNRAQAAAIGEVSVAIGLMDQSTQQNAAMVEETSAAARNLAAEVTSLSDEAARFKVGRNNAPSVRKPVAAEPPVTPRAMPRALAMAGDDWTSF